MDEPNEQDVPRDESDVVMEARPQEQAAEQAAKRGGELCAALGAALSAALDAAGAGSWQIQTSPEARASGPSLDKQALCFALTLTGDLAGQCFVTISKQDAATLVAATGKPPASVLLKVMQGAAVGLTARLSPAYEGIAVTVGKARAVSSGCVAAGSLEAIGEGAAALWLSFDPQLAQSIDDPDGVRRALAGRARRRNFAGESRPSSSMCRSASPCGSGNASWLCARFWILPAARLSSWTGRSTSQSS